LTTTLYFDKGSIVVRGQFGVPNAVWDERIRAFRTQAFHYKEILNYLDQSHLQFQDNVQDLVPCPHLSCEGLVLRGYQKKALKSWESAGRRGVIVLPTGAGKTVVALKAIELVNEPTVVVVPTLDLLEQWGKRISKEFNIETGVLGGGENIIRAVTVSTYDSAYLRAGEIGNKFSLLVADEVHHIASEGYRQIAEMFSAPFRMGLTATLEREDLLHNDIPRLIGGTVFRLEPEDLAGRYLSDYSLEKVNVDLSDEERESYTRHHKIFTDFLASRKIRISSPLEFQRFIMRSASDREARKALLARNKALEISLNSEAKIEALEKILQSNPNERILIFTQHNQLVHKISRRFLLPYITYRTDKDERHKILDGFRDGSYRAIVTSKVLDEGIDVPEASLGIILSGSGSSREFVQRLGRLLRKKEGKGKAKLIELVSSETSEVSTSSRRKTKRSRESK